MTVTEALAAWGAYDLDDPFPVFEQVRQLGPVHPVTLADGHDAWLVVRYEEARAALNDQRLSKDMHAALATGSAVVAEGLPDQSSPGTCLRWTRRTTLACGEFVSAAFSPKRVEALRARVQTITDDLLDDIAARGPDTRSILSQPSRSRCRSRLSASFWVCPSPTGPSSAKGSPSCSCPPRPRRIRGGQGCVRCRRRDAPNSGRSQTDRSRRRSRQSDLISARDGRRALDSQELLSTIFQLIVAGHDTTASLDRQQPRRSVPQPGPAARAPCDPTGIPSGRRGVPSLRRPGSPFHVPIHDRTVTIGGVDIPAGDQVIICLAAANRDDDVRQAGGARHRSGRDPSPGVRTRHPSLSRRSAGAHGGPLALASLLRRFPAARARCPGRDLHWGHGDGLVLRGLSGVARDPGPSPPRRARTVTGGTPHGDRFDTPTDHGGSSTRAGGGRPLTSPPSANRRTAGSTSRCTTSSAWGPVIGCSTSLAVRAWPWSWPGWRGPVRRHRRVAPPPRRRPGPQSGR